MDGRRFWLMVLGAAWLLAWSASVAAFWVLEPSGDGFTRGLNRIKAFLGWQAIAACLALAVWGVGRSWPKAHAVRRGSRVPLAVTAVLALGLAAAVFWVRVG